MVRVLRSAGHEVLAVAELAAGLDDTDVMDIAVREERLLLTEDRDFGRLVYAHSQQFSGVIFPDIPLLLERLFRRLSRLSYSSKTQTDLSVSFTMMSPERVRIDRRIR